LFNKLRRVCVPAIGPSRPWQGSGKDRTAAVRPCRRWSQGGRRPQSNSQTRGQCRSIREDDEGAAKDRVGTRHPRSSAFIWANPASPRAPIARGSIRRRSCRVQAKIALPRMNPGSGPGQAQMHANISVPLAESGAPRGSVANLCGPRRC